MSYYTKMSRKQEKNNFAPHDIYSYSDTAVVLFLAACFNFSFSLVFVWSCHFSFY